MKILDVGCGVNKTPGAIGLDNNPKTAADVIHDLGTVPYPFPDNEFDTVVSNHTVEHVPDIMAFVSELYRITKHGGTIKLVTPHYTNPDWANDPTHRNHINSYTFNTFMPERAVFDFYTDVKLLPVRTYVSLLKLWKALGIEFFVNLDQRFKTLRFTRKFWEHYLSYIFRGKEIFFEFAVMKTDFQTKRLAEELTRLAAFVPTRKDELDRWYSQAERLRNGSLLWGAPQFLHLYLSDADIRMKDEAYAEMQGRRINLVLDHLNRGVMPSDKDTGL